MSNQNRISVAGQPNSRTGGVCVRLDDDRNLTVSAWFQDTEVSVVISHEQAPFLAERFLDQEQPGAVHAFSSDAFIFNADSGEQP